MNDRVEVNLPGTLTNIAGLGTPGVEIGAGVKGHTNIFGGGDVWVRSQARVEGFIRTPGLIRPQDASVQLLGPLQPNTAVPTQTFSWTATFPTNPLPLSPVTGDVTLAPGGYVNLNVNGGRAFLRSGVYFFETFNTEPNALVKIDNTAGPVVIYVRSQFTFKGPFVDEARPGQVLVGYLGTQVAFLQAPFLGTMVAPNGEIELHRPTSSKHQGAWFAKQLEVFSDSHILHTPFDWNTLPTDDDDDDLDVPDTDGDGTNDRDDRCLLDATKTQPGECGCNRLETDRDNDLTPDCVDLCPDDPNNTRDLACGCVGSPTLRPAGTPCVIEECSGTSQESTCDGAGRCGTANSCAPAANCVSLPFRNSLYWLCDGPVAWQQAESACSAQSGRYLASADNAAENRWITRAVARHVGPSAWLGGNDLTTASFWSWSNASRINGPLFWGGGLPVAGRFANWEGPQPGPEHCLTLQSDGTWSDANCALTQGFVCEQPILRLPTFPNVRPCDFYPGFPCDEEIEPLPDAPCVDNDVEFPFTGSDEERIEQASIAYQKCIT
ncbi:MAG TPA: C-type lectin domain-containing protein, partial [Polyangiaceae bacterium]